MRVEELELVFDQLPQEALSRYIIEQLDAHNLAATGNARYYPVGYFLKNTRGEWLGGLIGSLWSGWLHVRILWVDPAVRGQGNGARLLRAAEEYAVERGCFAATLETHSFHARPFYEKLGYEVFGALDQYPPGHSKFFLRKRLLPDPPERARELLDFWFVPEDDPDRERHREIWFKSTEEFDAVLRCEFLTDYEAATAGELRSWETSPEGALALVLLLDQVPRNIFRATARAYAADPAARATAERALARGFDQMVPPVWRLFFYMPFHHSEDNADQRRSLTLFEALPRDPHRGGSLRRYGCRYIEVIERFGRFPHRNEILGRQSTAEEMALLAELNSLT